VQLGEDGDQPLLVNLTLLGGERFASAQLFEDVVHAGHGQAGMEFLLAFAVGVELLGAAVTYG